MCAVLGSASSPGRRSCGWCQPPSHRRYEARANYFELMKIIFIFCQIVLLIAREFRQPTGIHDGPRESPAVAIISLSGWRCLRLNPMVLYRLLFLFLECRTRMGLTAKTAPRHLHRPIRAYRRRGDLTVNRAPGPQALSTSIAPGWCLIHDWQRERPDPVPGPIAAGVSNEAIIWSRSERPVSVMATTASWEVGLKRMLELSPPGMAFEALSRRFRKAWVNNPRRP
jgi:hypothetical protein